MKFLKNRMSRNSRPSPLVSSFSVVWLSTRTGHCVCFQPFVIFLDPCGTYVFSRWLSFWTHVMLS